MALVRSLRGTVRRAPVAESTAPTRGALPGCTEGSLAGDAFHIGSQLGGRSAAVPARQSVSRYLADRNLPGGSGPLSTATHRLAPGCLCVTIARARPTTRDARGTHGQCLPDLHERAAADLGDGGPRAAACAAHDRPEPLPGPLARSALSQRGPGAAVAFADRCCGAGKPGQDALRGIGSPRSAAAVACAGHVLRDTGAAPAEYSRPAPRP